MGPSDWPQNRIEIKYNWGSEMPVAQTNPAKIDPSDTPGGKLKISQEARGVICFRLNPAGCRKPLR